MGTLKLSKPEIENLARRVAASVMVNWNDSQRDGSESSKSAVPPAGWAGFCAEELLAGEGLDDASHTRVVAQVVKFTR